MMKQYMIYFKGEACIEAEDRDAAYKEFRKDNPGWDIDIEEITTEDGE